MSLSSDPIARFQKNWAAARRGTAEESCDAMTLSTVAGGRPRSRVVLLRGVDERGFVFYTNLESDKGREIAASDRVALCFHWPQTKVQIRIEGRATPVTDAEADAYFATRPLASQIGAWASDQSRPLGGRRELLTRVAAAVLRFGRGPVPRPPHWSGFRVTPDLIEFWYAKPHRLHDRHRYERRRGGWRHTLLYP